MIKAGWNSMNRIDYSTPLLAGSTLAGAARHTCGTQPPGLTNPASKRATYASQILWPLLWVWKARIRAWSAYISLDPTNKLLSGKINDPKQIS